MNTDTIIRDNAAYLASAGQARSSWSPDTVPDGKSSKGRMLEGYLQNAERCVVKEGYGAFNEMDAETRKEWKAISCTQGLVSPADPM
ncbi:uncharacterized protein MICPUCDRAFT_59132 [Micromonas pusilla CCMP1545]|uniref:Predicted protein n=1 Tax=Micromonas pusilla (strain CCMP1545) TaxID=564608 RepID=C1MVB6_MICPC|nr:uncharacterized protein MICPUCDRAFT_59132 [Micromonas pusilla CCMP1545]EEH56770.1 predicted protein [Micromonas pusilla CCMP1545]|eukprot:XP_003059638.1 predicted protein [Micromonas pusilla CCMP1545]